MATQHKTATAVTLAPLDEKTGLQKFVDAYWKYAVLLVAVIVGVTMFWHRRGQSNVIARRASWDKLVAGAGLEGFVRRPTVTPESLATLAGELKGSEAEGWSRLLQVQALLDKHDYAAARQALDELRKSTPSSSLGGELWLDPSTSALESAVDRLDRAIKAQEQWHTDHKTLFANPEPANDAPRVRVKTDLGDFTVALYPDRAPKHAENFLALVSQGYFNGTKFHRVANAQWIEGGDPNSKQEDVSKWGLGDAERQLAVEDSGLDHFEGALSANPGAAKDQSSGSLFTITTAPQHSWDGERVVFGTVVEGLDIVRRIADGALAEGSPDRPAQPIGVVATERL